MELGESAGRAARNPTRAGAHHRSAPDERDRTGRQRDVEQWPDWAADAESASQARLALLSLEWLLLVLGILVTVEAPRPWHYLGLVLVTGFLAINNELRRR